MAIEEQGNAGGLEGSEIVVKVMLSETTAEIEM
jgi:hypothetical protein